MAIWKLSATLFGVALSGLAAQPAHARTDQASWTTRAPLPIAMAEVGVAALGGKVYVVGGTEQRGKAPTIWASTLTIMYDPAANIWRKRASLPHGLTHAGVTALDGKLYAIGSFIKPVHIGPQNWAFVYDPGTNKWSALPPLAVARGSVAAVAVGDKIHVFGGRISNRVVKISSPPGTPAMFSGFGTVTTHQIYSPQTGEWSTGAPIPGPGRDHVGVAVLDGKVHLFGGRTADVQDNLDRHDVYDPATDRWTSAAPLPRPRSAGAYTVLDGLIIYAGGECKPGGQPFTPNAYDDVTGYDPKTDSWTVLPPLPQARHAFGAATVSDVAYFVGGAPVCGGGATTGVTAFTWQKR